MKKLITDIWVSVDPTVLQWTVHKSATAICAALGCE